MRIDLAGRLPLHDAELPVCDDGESGLVIDADRLEFASPLDLAATAALAHAYTAADVPAALVLPADPAVASYLRRMDLLDRLPAGALVIGQLPPQERRDHATRLLEVTPLTPNNAEVIVERVGRVATANLGQHFGARAFKAMGELIDNATTHGRGGTGAYICAQAYTGRTTDHPGLQVAVCDTGVGVLAHLRRNPQHASVADHVEALQSALQPGVSGTGEQRGNGLPDLLTESSPTGDTLLILRSGNGLISARRGPGTGTMADGVRSAGRVAGTWAWLSVTYPP
ncbi:hypothetical protein ACWGLF_39820 [Streptomyces puniciscabiei]